MSSETVEVFRALDDIRKAKRKVFGIPCPECVRKLPRANPTILLQGQRCKIHKYHDPRPEPTTAELNAALGPYGFEIKDVEAK